MNISEPKFEQHTFNIKGNSYSFFVMREDLLHPVFSGNKWRKLDVINQVRLDSGKLGIASCGGPYSNHLHALAFFGKEMGIRTKAIVPGKHFSFLSRTLQDCEAWGMDLTFVSRSEFDALRYQTERPDLVDESYFWCGEGGWMLNPFQGYAKINLADWSDAYFHCGVGSGGTIGGLALNPFLSQKITGYPCVSGDQELHCRLVEFGSKICLEEQHVGHGYGKLEKSQLDFADDFFDQTGIILDPVYTLKMAYYFFCHGLEGGQGKDERHVLVHSGGVQGWAGFKERPKCCAAIT
ncbi:MAG: 1-aminocyclopropane-1-carboxylate deaminase [Sphingobacteriales bacterium]|jgi:1-aminocyclopropane-1-carboxylate deaminase